MTKKDQARLKILNTQYDDEMAVHYRIIKRLNMLSGQIYRLKAGICERCLRKKTTRTIKCDHKGGPQ